MSETINYAVLKQLVDAGAIRGADVVGQPGGWTIMFRYGSSQKTLAAHRGNVRVFSNLTTVMKFLDKLGIMQFSVDSSFFKESVKRYTRPDRLKKSTGE